MPRNVRVCILTPRKYMGEPSHTPSQALDDVIHHWERHLSNAFAVEPDMIVLPEACDRPNCLSMERRLEYYEYRRDKVRDHFLELAVKNNTNIAYSAARLLDDGTYRNSTQFLSRRGIIDGIYDKNYLVPDEYTESGILYGREAPIIETDFGKVGGVICFDIHYDVRKQYEKNRPELLVFSSNHHGGLLQAYWAYSTQAYFAAAIPVDHGCGAILNPVGKILAESTYRYPNLAYADIDLDYKVCHWDGNWSKVLEAQKKYGRDLQICEPDGHLGLFMLTYSGDKTDIAGITDEFELETWDEYYSRCVKAREEHLN